MTRCRRAASLPPESGQVAAGEGPLQVEASAGAVEAEQLTREKSDTVRAEIEQQIRIMEGAEERVPKPRMPGK